MSKIAFIFPGQGSQSVGMGADLIEQNENNKLFYERADKVMGMPLSKIMLEGPGEELTKTYYAQPALLTTGVMIATQLMEAGVQPDFVAGHSLGEYSAFVIAGVLQFEDGVKIVHNRGLYMNEAVPAGEGTMAAVLAMDETTLQVVCDEVNRSGQCVGIANYNCPGQIVISGTKEGVRLASIGAKDAGAKRVIELPVSGPFHSKLMQPAAQKLEQYIQNITLHTPKIPVISNVHSKLLESVEEVQLEMVEQVIQPVDWQRNVEALLNQGVTKFIECGPGNVLSGLVRKINRSAEVFNVYDQASYDKLVELAKGWKQWA